MLQMQVIRDQTEKVIAGLNKRNFKEAESLIANVIATDKLRRDTQRTLDDIKAKSNSDSKKIGELMKTGKNEEATALRNSVTADKDRIKELEAEMTNAEAELQQLLYHSGTCKWLLQPFRPRDNCSCSSRKNLSGRLYLLQLCSTLSDR